MTKIEWTDRVWNPITGCSKVSEGCKNCYAERFANRLQKNPKTCEKYKFGFAPTFHLFELEKPYKWNKQSKIFVCSMGDLFHEKIVFEAIRAVFMQMLGNTKHTFQILTKRPERLLEYIEWEKKTFILTSFFTKNIWIGVSVENQKTADERIPLLKDVPAAVKFVSIEPILGPVDLIKLCNNKADAFDPAHAGINWVICGGETGPGARPYHPSWIESIQEQCQLAGIPFFFKGYGDWYSRWVDMPSNKPTFKYYNNYLQWTQKLWVGKGDACIDLDGLICKNGGDMQIAKYPVAILSKVGKKHSSNEINNKTYQNFPKL